VVNFTIGDTTYVAGQTASIANVGTLLIGANGAYHLHPGRQLQRHGADRELHRHRRLGQQRHFDPEHQPSRPVDDPSVLIADTKTVDEDHVATGNVLGK